MSETKSSRSTGASVRAVARRLKLGRKLRGMTRIAPPWIKDRVDDWIIMANYEPIVPEAALEECLAEALTLLRDRAGEGALGDYLEFGVCHGTSIACMDRALRGRGEAGVRIFGFDSFEGLPESAACEDAGTWQPGDFRSTIRATRGIMASKGVALDRVTLVKGWFGDTLNDALVREHAIDKAGVIMIDCDIYSSARQALEFCAPLIRDAAVILFDDWHSGGLADKNMGEKRAFDEMLAANPGLRGRALRSYRAEAEVFLVERTA